MTEYSRFWNNRGAGAGVGDADTYDAPTEFSEVIRAIAGDGVIFGEANELNLSANAGSVDIQSGQGFAWGGWYKNDANVNFAIPTPASATRIDRIVLRKDWAAQTIRLRKLTGTEGGAAPSLTQNVGTIWEVLMWAVGITTGGAIVPVDERGSGGVLGSATPSAIDIGDAGITGASDRASHEDHQHAFAQAADGDISNQDFGDVRDAGVLTTVAPADHKHGMPKLFRARKTAATSYTSTSGVNDPHLALALTANEIYYIDGTIFYTGAASGPALRTLLTLPAGASSVFEVIGPEATVPTEAFMQRVTTDWTVGSLNDIQPRGYRFSGVITVAGTGGTAQFQFAKATGTVDAISVDINSVITATRVA